MISQKSFINMALLLPETSQKDHHGIFSFFVAGKIYATLNYPEKRCTLKLNAEFQDLFTVMGKGSIYKVPNAWGKYGWTHVELKTQTKELLRDALLIAWRLTAPKKFVTLYSVWFEDKD